MTFIRTKIVARSTRGRTLRVCEVEVKRSGVVGRLTNP